MSTSTLERTAFSHGVSGDDFIVLRGAGGRTFTASEVSAVSMEMARAQTPEEASAAFRKLPIHPAVAPILKRVLGKDEFLAQGYDLTMAQEELGEDWLDKP